MKDPDKLPEIGNLARIAIIEESVDLGNYVVDLHGHVLVEHIAYFLRIILANCPRVLSLTRTIIRALNNLNALLNNAIGLEVNVGVGWELGLFIMLKCYLLRWMLTCRSQLSKRHLPSILGLLPRQLDHAAVSGMR